MSKKIYETIIIGGGPAGVTAGIYAARKRMDALLITQDFLGQPGKTSWVENYPGFERVEGQKLAKRFESHLKSFDIDIEENQEVEKIKKEDGIFKLTTEDGDEFQSKTAIVCSGANPRRLGIPGEKRLKRKGVSYCSICDAPFFDDKKVAIIGGGNSGMEAALDLIEYANRITVLEISDSLGGDEILQDKVKDNDKVHIFFNKKAKKIIGDEKVEALIYKDTKTDKTFQIPVDGIFVEAGLVPASGFLNDLVDYNDLQEVKVDCKTQETKTEGLYAAGDVNEGKWKQIVTSIGEGATALLSAFKYLKSKKDD